MLYLLYSDEYIIAVIPFVDVNIKLNNMYLVNHPCILEQIHINMVSNSFSIVVEFGVLVFY